MAPPYLVILFCTTGEFERDGIIWPVGLLVFLAGLGLRVWAQRYVKYRLPIRKQLAVAGPYRFMRNPIYVGNTLLLVGLTILSELVWFVPFMLLWAATVYFFVVRYEESHLVEKYGAPYSAYLASVPRWFPRGPLKAVPHAGQLGGLWASVVVELHCLLLIIPLACKEILEWI